MNKQDTCASFTSVRLPKPEIFVEMFRRNLQRIVGKRHVGAHQTWGPKYCKHLEVTLLSRRLIIFTEQTSIYINTFPNALTSKNATSHEIGIYFSTNAIVALSHAPP